MFRVGQQAKRNDTGAVVSIIEVLPIGRMVFYRIEYPDGLQSVVPDAKLRASN